MKGNILEHEAPRNKRKLSFKGSYFGVKNMILKKLDRATHRT